MSKNQTRQIVIHDSPSKNAENIIGEWHGSHLFNWRQFTLVMPENL